MYCGKSGHYAKDCYKKQVDIRSGKLQHGNYASSSHDDCSKKLFAMQQKMHSTTMQDDMRDDVWYVDSGASNHMTSRGNWFKELDAMRTPGYVETGDDTVHPIEHMVLRLLAETSRVVGILQEPLGELTSSPLPCESWSMMELRWCHEHRPRILHLATTRS